MFKKLLLASIITCFFAQVSYATEPLELGIVDNPNDNADISLAFAIRDGNIEKVTKAVDNGANLNARYGVYGYTPIFLAVEKGALEIIKFIIEKGAIVNIKDFNNRSVLEYAESIGNKEVTALLKKNAKTGY